MADNFFPYVAGRSVTRGNDDLHDSDTVMVLGPIAHQTPRLNFPEEKISHCVAVDLHVPLRNPLASFCPRQCRHVCRRTSVVQSTTTPPHLKQ